MSTRLYLSSTASAPVNPNFSSFWNETNDADRKKCNPYKTSSILISKSMTEESDVADWNVLNRQYVSAALKPQTISGTIKGQVRCKDTKRSDFYTALCVRIVDNELNEVAVLYSGVGSNNWDDNNYENRYYPAQSAIPTVTLTGEMVCLQSGYLPPSGGSGSGSGQLVCLQSGWSKTYHIVVEYGANAQNARGARDGEHIFGDNSSTDLPEDETSQSSYNPWIEFSKTLYFN